MRRLVSMVIVAGLCLLVSTPAVAQMGPGGEEDEFIDLPPVDQPVAQTEQGTRDLAIVIAVQQYHNMPNVAGAEVTGLDWKAFFSGHLGMADDRVLFISNARAIPSVIEREVAEHLEKADEQGRVWFVFIGHGAPDPTERDPEGLLVGAGALNHTAEDFRVGSLPKSRVEEMLAEGPQKQTVMVLDTCFSGQTEHGQSLTGTQAVVPDPSRLEPELGERDIVFTAARHDEAAHSLPGPTVDRPAFSYALLGALRGWADTTGDGTVTPAEAENYVRRALVGMQTPSVTVEDDSIRAAALVTHATEEEPGFARTLQALINRGRAFAEAEPCEVEGHVRNVDTQGHCCWPGQAYSSVQNTCVGSPMCPDGMVLGGDGECREAEEGEEAYARGVDRSECETPERCRQMGQDAYYGFGEQQDYERAAEFFERACDQGGQQSCVWLGSLYAAGKGIEEDPKRAVELFDDACDAGVMAGCRRLGRQYQSGAGVEQSEERALELFRQACEGEDGESCYWVGHSLLSEDRKKSTEFMELACRNGYGNGCYYLINFTEISSRDVAELRRELCGQGTMAFCVDLGDQYMVGEGVEQNYDIAITLYERACYQAIDPAVWERSCLRLGAMFRTGKGVERDIERAIKLFREVCEKTNNCLQLAYQYRNGEGVEKNSAKAMELFQHDENRCPELTAWEEYSPEEPPSFFFVVLGIWGEERKRLCGAFGKQYRDGDGVSTDIRRASDLYFAGCFRGGIENHCRELGRLYSQDEKLRGVAAGRGLFEDGCLNPVEEELIFTCESHTYFFQAACQKGVGEACANLGLLYQRGQGVEQDVRRAAELYEKACEKDYSQTCESLEVLGE